MFEKGTALRIAPIKIIYLSMELDSLSPVQAGFSVPKTIFKRAVDRNLLKRRMREAYRRNKKLLYDGLENSGKQFAIMFIYSKKEVISYEEIEGKIILFMERLITKHVKGS